MYAESSKSYAYQGLVISSVIDSTMDQSDLVLLLKDDKGDELDKRRVYGVSRQAFIPPVVESDFSKVDIAKNRERRYAIPLKFGDIIQWNDGSCDHDKNIITGFKRERPLYEVSSCASGHLLKLGGIIQPSKPTTFWTPFQSLLIPVSEAIRAEPDVFLHAWIKFETLMMNSQDPVHLELTFIRFDDCDYAQQGRVSEAPWHRTNLDSKFSVWKAEPSPVDSDDEIDVEEPEGIIKEENKWAEIIHKQLGLYVGERLIICKDLPQYDFIIPLLTPMTLATDEKTLIYPSVGEYFHFSAIWSNNHRSFLVRDMMPYLTLRSHMITPNGNLCVRVKDAKEKGLFIDNDESLGLIDDPSHCLSFLEFHSLGFRLRPTVEIRAVRSTENRTTRYRIVRLIIDEQSMHQYQDWVKNSDFSVGPICGIVINRDTVVSAAHPNIYFRLPSGGERRPIGAGIRFRAKRQLGVYKEMMITESHIAPEASVKVLERPELCLFQLRLRTVPGHEQLAMNPLVGLVDTRQHDPPKNAGDEYSAWVRESPFRGDCRRAATILEIHSTSAVPIYVDDSDTTLPSSSNSSTHGPNYGNSDGSGSRSSRDSSNSFSSSRFVGPRSSTKKSTDGHTSSAASSMK